MEGTAQAKACDMKIHIVSRELAGDPAQTRPSLQEVPKLKGGRLVTSSSAWRDEKVCKGVSMRTGGARPFPISSLLLDGGSKR